MKGNDYYVLTPQERLTMAQTKIRELEIALFQDEIDLAEVVSVVPTLSGEKLAAANKEIKRIEDQVAELRRRIDAIRFIFLGDEFDTPAEDQ